MDRFQVQHDAWFDTLEKFEQTFAHAVGPPDKLTMVAQRMGLKHMKGIDRRQSAELLFRWVEYMSEYLQTITA